MGHGRLALLVLLSGLLAGVVWLAPASAAGAVLYDQTDAPAGSPFLSTETAPPRDTQVADDFVVPAGHRWTIEQVDVAGLLDGTPPAEVNVFLYADAGTLPGAELFSALDVAATGGPNYSVPVAAPQLSPGSYWISVQQANGSGANEWFWETRTMQFGDAAAFRNPSGDLYPACTDWMTRTTCEPITTSPDQIFKLSGTDSQITQPAPVNPTPPASVAAPSPTQTAKRCKKGRKLKKGKCRRKRR
jgi:hypothetical protein